jgi:hypothetical protein
MSSSYNTPPSTGVSCLMSTALPSKSEGPRFRGAETRGSAALALGALPFHKRLQPRQSFVPLLGNSFQIRGGLFDRAGDVYKLAFPANSSRYDYAGPLKDVEVFGHPLSCQVDALRQLSDGARLAIIKARDKFETCCIT